MKEIALRDKEVKKKKTTSGKQTALAEVKKYLQKKGRRQQLYFPGQKYKRKEKL